MDRTDFLDGTLVCLFLHSQGLPEEEGRESSGVNERSLSAVGRKRIEFEKRKGRGPGSLNEITEKNIAKSLFIL